jgi:hypothetical protein
MTRNRATVPEGLTILATKRAVIATADLEQAVKETLKVRDRLGYQLRKRS